MDDLLGKRVFNGIGEPLGEVVGVVRDAKGRVRLRVREPGPLGPIRLVGAEHVAGVDEVGIRLKGPRQGYHIAPLSRLASVPAALEPPTPPSGLRDRW